MAAQDKLKSSTILACTTGRVGPRHDLHMGLLSAGLRDLDTKSLRCTRQAIVITVEAPEVLTEAEDGRQVKSIQRAKLDRIQVSGRFEDHAIEREERDSDQTGPSPSDGQLAVTPCRTYPLHNEQSAAEEISADKLTTQRSALWL
jgi:hypothetical protein